MADPELLQAEILEIIEGLTYVFKVGYACSIMLFNKRRGMFWGEGGYSILTH